MPDQFRVDLDSRAVDKLAGDTQAKALMDRVGRQVADRAADLAPKRSGRGAAAISHDVDSDTDGAFTNVGYEPQGWYMAFQELGTASHAPQPHLRPAIGEDLNL